MNIKGIAYAAWIECEVERNGYGKCREVVEAMHKTFPELEPRFGFFFASFPWGRRQHWWLRAPDRSIVDPTGKQHPNGSIFPETDAGYEDLTDLDPEALADKVPSGVCADCGSPVYRGDSFCDATCEAATMRYLGMELKENGNWGNP